MKCVGGVWYYRGRSYATLYEALAAVWPLILPGRAGKKGAALVLEHQGGRAEQIVTNTVSASSLHKNRRNCQV